MTSHTTTGTPTITQGLVENPSKLKGGVFPENHAGIVHISAPQDISRQITNYINNGKGAFAHQEDGVANPVTAAYTTYTITCTDLRAADTVIAAIKTAYEPLKDTPGYAKVRLNIPSNLSKKSKTGFEMPELNVTLPYKHRLDLSKLISLSHEKFGEAQKTAASVTTKTR